MLHLGFRRTTVALRQSVRPRYVLTLVLSHRVGRFATGAYPPYTVHEMLLFTRYFCNALLPSTADI